MIRKKDDPPGGTTGRVGCGTGWMRRPCRTQIHNQSVFERSMPSDLIRGPAPDLIRGPAPDLIRGGYLFASRKRVQRRLQFSRSSVVIAGADEADVIAISVELANPAAAAIAVGVVAVVGSDRAADHGGAKKAGSDAPGEAAATAGLCMGGGGSKAAGDGKCGQRKGCNFGFDRH